MNRRRVVLIIVYIGKLPDFFEIWLNSCKQNPSIEWLLYTDDHSGFSYPSNVKPIYTTFSEIKQLFQSKYPFTISLDSHVKLCDYKTAYGDIFQEEIKDYDYWGYCDIDVIWGNITHFITRYSLLQYDKACDTGHFTLYKNTIELSTLYKKGKEKGLLDYVEVFTSPKIYAFDEWGLGKGINAIFLAHNKSLFYQKILFADIEVYSYALRTTRTAYGDAIQEEKEKENIIYQYKDGYLYQHYKKGIELFTSEEMYIHLQKRPMTYPLDLTLSNFLITAPNRMINWPVDSPITIKTLMKYGSNRKRYWPTIIKAMYKKLKSILK
jgi:hypothetical protein